MQDKIPEPTIGRVVHVYSSADFGVSPRKPHAAIVADVYEDGLTINVGFISHEGQNVGVQNIPHISQRKDGVHFWWDWMPFQKGQAAKTEQLQQELDRQKDRLHSHSDKASRDAGDRDMDELHKNQAMTPMPRLGKGY